VSCFYERFQGLFQEIVEPQFSRDFHNPLGVQAARDPLPADARPDIFFQNVHDVDERMWVTQADGVQFLPLCFGVTQGYYVNLLRVRKSGVLSCHRHLGAVHAHVIKGRWFYMEHEEMYTEGYIYLDGDRITGYEDVFTKLAAARAHYEEHGLDQKQIDRLVR
jgi:hypothetical protein